MEIDKSLRRVKGRRNSRTIRKKNKKKTENEKKRTRD